jgi:hypothetical protein
VTFLNISFDTFLSVPIQGTTKNYSYIAVRHPAYGFSSSMRLISLVGSTVTNGKTGARSRFLLKFYSGIGTICIKPITCGG